ncbi:MAG: zinc dependent phospholipase C family protein [Pseudomonadota bacterium]
MAGAYTHMAIVASAIKSFAVDQKFGKILRENKNFLTLGSVSPDIPYLAHLAMGGFAWADIIHYHKTNGIVKNALHSLSAAKTKGKIWNYQMAWLLGFVGHLVADATIHPIVESIVGPYTDKDTRNNHRQCEMIQDVMILKDVMNLELYAAEYSDVLKACIKHPSFEKVAFFWAAHAEVNCPMAGSFPAKKIIDSYVKEIDTAEGGNAIAKAFRHFGLDYVYRTHSDIKKNSPELVKKYYTSVQLPNGQTGSFREQGFDHAVKNLVTVWSKIERSLFSTENIANIIPNWNLDTGIDQDTEIRTYWS